MTDNTVVIDSIKWHRLCYELQFDSYPGRADRKSAFEDYFKCKVKWKSRLEEWDGVGESPVSVMILTFVNSTDATLFRLKYA